MATDETTGTCNQNPIIFAHCFRRLFVSRSESAYLGGLGSHIVSFSLDRVSALVGGGIPVERKIRKGGFSDKIDGLPHDGKNQHCEGLANSFSQRRQLDEGFEHPSAAR